MSREDRFRLSAAAPENDEIRMTNGEGMTKSELAHDASDKVFWNSEVPSVVSEEAIDKSVGAATSVGANYVEADDAVSKREFLKNIGTCPKEARETKHFLRMIVRVSPELKPRARILWTEANELHLIFFQNLENGEK